MIVSQHHIGPVTLQVHHIGEQRRLTMRNDCGVTHIVATLPRDEAQCARSVERAIVNVALKLGVEAA